MPKQEPENQITIDAAFLVNYAAIAQELAAIQGLMKKLKDRDGALRTEMKDAAYELREMHVLPKSMDVAINGTKVGTATMSSVGKEWACIDEDALEQWALANNFAGVSESINLANLTAEQVALLRVWAAANGVAIDKRVTVDRKELDKNLVRLGENVVYRPTGETVPGLAGCESDLRPMIRVPDTDVLFAALGGSAEVLPSGDAIPVKQAKPLETYSIEEVAE